MKPKPVIPRVAAVRDVEETVDHYAAEGARQAALSLIDALERAYTEIGRHPGAGSPRYAHELDIPGLQSWSLGRHPYVVFYIEREDHVDVWRVLDGRRDIPAGMASTSEGR